MKINTEYSVYNEAHWEMKLVLQAGRLQAIPTSGFLPVGSNNRAPTTLSFDPHSFSTGPGPIFSGVIDTAVCPCKGDSPTPLPAPQLQGKVVT